MPTFTPLKYICTLDQALKQKWRDAESDTVTVNGIEHVRANSSYVEKKWQIECYTQFARRLINKCNIPYFPVCIPE